MIVTVIEAWRVIDKWWRPIDEQIIRCYVEADWNGRRVIFRREAPDEVWRIANATER